MFDRVWPFASSTPSSFEARFARISGGVLPRRTVTALTTGFLAVAAAAVLLGPSLRAVLAEDDSRLEYLRSLRAERGQERPRSAWYAPQPQQQRPFFYFGRSTPPRSTLAYAPAAQPIAFGPFDAKPKPKMAARSAHFVAPSRRLVASASGAGLSQRAVCVRLCDGFYFPVGDYAGEGEAGGQSSLCAGLCPGAPTRLYVVPSGAESVEDAISLRDRKPYRALPVAWRHTTKRDATCSCQRPDQTTATSFPVLKDFTLRRGDKVMTETGFRVFRGGASLPYRPKDFSTLSASRDVSETERRSLAALERASGVRQNATPRLSTAPAAIPMTPISSRLVSDPAGRSIRLIGPQAMLLSAPTPAQP